MRLLIGIPSYDYIHVEFARSLSALLIRLTKEGVDFDVHFEAGTMVYAARDKIACKALNEGYTHVLWLDTDMVFTDDILDAMMFCGEKMVCGVFQSRRKGYHACTFKNLDINHLERFEEYPSETFEVEGCGFGCVLVDAEILKAVQTRYGTCFFPERMYGEDLAFCRRVKACGYRIYAEPSAVVGHVGHVTIYPEDHEKWKREVSEYQELSRR